MSVLKGETIAHGVAVGPVHLRGFDSDALAGKRIAADQVENELNRLREAMHRSRVQIEEIRQKQRDTLGEADLRIFDTHLTYLGDPVFVTEIENQVLQERFDCRGAVRAVLEKYDRIFQLVENDLLRRRASDLRDVSTRVLRNLADSEPSAVSPKAPVGRYILAARKLTTADMFNLNNEQVDGIVAEEGGLSSHAAILARAMGIPTLSGIRELGRLLRDGDVVVVDANAGQLRLQPSDDELAAAATASAKWRDSRREAPAEQFAHQTRDGVTVVLGSACGSVGEVEMGRTFGLDGIGLYRTELVFLAEKGVPTEEQLVQHYREVLQAGAGQRVHLRLLDVAVDTLTGGRTGAERNPALGQRGVRGLLKHQAVLRLQLRAILRAAVGRSDVAVLVPFVTSVNDLQRVKAAVLEERLALRRADQPVAEDLQLAPIVEVPAAAIAIGPLLDECEFAVIAVDDLQAYLLAADRDNANVREFHHLPHPALFEVLGAMAREAARRDRRLVLFGESAAEPARVPFYVGVGFREFAIAPVRLRSVLKVLRRYSQDECRRIAARILEAPRALDVQKVLVNIEVD